MGKQPWEIWAAVIVAWSDTRTSASDIAVAIGRGARETVCGVPAAIPAALELTQNNVNLLLLLSFRHSRKSLPHRACRSPKARALSASCKVASRAWS